MSKIKSYKQYCVPLDGECKHISCFKYADIGDLYCPVDYALAYDVNNDRYKHELRTSHFSVVDFDGDGTDIGDYVTDEDIEYPDCDCSPPQEAMNYMRIFFNKDPMWQLICTEIYEDGILFNYVQLDMEGVRTGDFLGLILEIPKKIIIQIDLDADDFHPFETYLITMCKDAPIRIEYKINGIMQYSSTLHEDEKGLYELIIDTI